MRPTILAAGVAAFAIAAPALAKPTPASSLSISASPSPITFGSSSTVSGVLSGKQLSGVTVTLENRAASSSGAFAKGPTAKTDSTGHYTFMVTPGQNTTYRAVAKASPTAMSSDALVNVKVKVTEHLSTTKPRAGHAVRLSGLVIPAYNGKFAQIQRKTASGWKTVASAKLVATVPVGSVQRSKYSKRVMVHKSGTYRVSFNPADGLRLANHGRARRVTVH
jgi:hypothetical protein